MNSPDPATELQALFDAERSARRIHSALLDGDPRALVPLLRSATEDALGRMERDPTEGVLRLVRLAALLGECEGPEVVDTLIDILGCEEPEARHAAGEALEDLAFERFKEVALGVERALTRLPTGNMALTELPYLLAEIREGGVVRLLARFLERAEPEPVAAAIEAIAELGDPSAIRLLEPLERDGRQVQLFEDDTESVVSIGELASETRALLEAAAGEQRPEPQRRGER